MKKTLSLMLALIMVLSVFTFAFAEEKTPDDLLHEKYEEPVVLNIVLGYRESENPDTPDDLVPQDATAIKYFKENFNIELNYSWIVNTDQFDSKFGAELAAGNLPDIMYLSANRFEDLYEQGGLADLTEVYDKYANDTIKEIVDFDGQMLQSGVRDGKLMGLPLGTYPGQSTSQIYYDMTKLKDVGITEYDQLPKTIEEFEALCDKLLEATGAPVLPANKYYMDAGLADFSPFFHAYEAWVGGWSDLGDGTLQYNGIQPELKPALTKMNEWYQKGYFAADFAAQDVWAADSAVVNDIVAGKYAIVPGSWWIPNWPLNSNKENNPDSEWVVGPTLTLDGELPTIMVSRYAVSDFVAVSAFCEHPEAVFKMMNWSVEYTRQCNNPEWKANASEEELKEWNSHVYLWLPYRIYAPACLVENYEFISKKAAEGSTECTVEEAPTNEEFWPAWNAYLAHVNGTETPQTWGLYLSRLDPNGGVAKMYELYSGAEKRYNELYVTTPAMISYSGEMEKLRDTTFLSMIMGETPIDEFDAYVEQWKAVGGDAVTKEVNEWYQSK